MLSLASSSECFGFDSFDGSALLAWSAACFAVSDMGVSDYLYANLQTSTSCCCVFVWVVSFFFLMHFFVDAPMRWLRRLRWSKLLVSKCKSLSTTLLTNKQKIS